MKLSRSEMNLLKLFSKMLNCHIECRLYGDIIFNNGKITAHSDKSYFTLDIFNSTVTVQDDDLYAYLVNRLYMSEVNINEFDWADQLYLNYCEVKVKSKIYSDREIFFTDFFTVAFKYFGARAITVIYRSKDRIYTALYFRKNRKFYNEYVVKNDKTGVFEKLLINQQSFVLLEEHMKDLSFLSIAPNYETPTLEVYERQLSNLRKKSKFKYKFWGDENA